jgi:hypothetical protein
MYDDALILNLFYTRATIQCLLIFVGLKTKTNVGCLWLRLSPPHASAL